MEQDLVNKKLKWSQQPFEKKDLKKLRKALFRTQNVVTPSCPKAQWTARYESSALTILSPSVATLEKYELLWTYKGTESRFPFRTLKDAQKFAEELIQTEPLYCLSPSASVFFPHDASKSFSPLDDAQ